MAYKITHHSVFFAAVLIHQIYSVTSAPSNGIDSRVNCCQTINITHSNVYETTIYEALYGTYAVVDTDSHGRQFYLKNDENGYYGIWWCNEAQSWVIGHSTNMGTCGSWYASANDKNTCVDAFGYDWKWYDYMNGAVLTSAGEGLKLVCSNPTTT